MALCIRRRACFKLYKLKEMQQLSDSSFSVVFCFHHKSGLSCRTEPDPFLEMPGVRWQRCILTVCIYVWCRPERTFTQHQQLAGRNALKKTNILSSEVHKMVAGFSRDLHFSYSRVNRNFMFVSARMSECINRPIKNWMVFIQPILRYCSWNWTMDNCEHLLLPPITEMCCSSSRHRGQDSLPVTHRPWQSSRRHCMAAMHFASSTILCFLIWTKTMSQIWIQCF